MPRIVISKPDSMVIVDGVALPVDCSGLPRYFHVVQWDGAEGHIEFSQDADGHLMPNIKITDISPFQHWLEEWRRERDRIAAEQAKAEAAKAAAIAASGTGGMHAFEE